MGNIKKVSLGIIFAVVFIISLYVFQNYMGGGSIVDNNDINNPINNQNEYMEENVLTKVVEIESIDDLELNFHPSFSLGQRFFYKTNSRPISGGEDYYEEETFSIERIERIKGREYYVIIRNNTGFLAKSSRIENLGSIINTWYCDKENGKCIGKNINPTEYSDENMFVTDSSFFAYWMLGLKDNLRWNIYVNATQIDASGTMHINKKYEFEVIGKEKVDDIPSFKVKMTYMDVDTKRIEETRYYWIDINRRILIKKVVFRDNIKEFEENLVDES